MRNIAIFASGSGTNAENIINHFNGGNIAKVVIVLSDKKNAFALERAKKYGIPAYAFSADEFDTGKVLKMLMGYSVDFIVLAGFLKLFPQSIIEKFPNKIVNIHPALLPKFGGKGMYGARVHQAVIDAKEAESGITIHYVNSNYDEGATIFQAKCAVFKDDTPDTLAQRVHALEYKYFPEIIESLLL